MTTPDPEPPRVSLQTIVHELDGLSDAHCVYLNRRTGETLFACEDAGFEPGDDEYVGVEAIDADDDYLMLPTAYDLHAWRIMADFITTIKDDAISEQLRDAIHGRGAFRMFRRTVERLDLLDDWYAYRTAWLRRFAIDWLERHGLAFVDDMTRPS